MLAIALEFLKPLIAKFGVYALLGLGLSIGWGLWYLERDAKERLLVESATKIERAKSNAIKAEEALKEQTKEFNRLIISQAEQKVHREYRDKQLAKTAMELNEERAKNASYQKRWTKVAFKKPKLLAAIVNRAVARRVRRIEAATCRADCNKDGT